MQVQVDRVLAFSALRQADIEAIFELLLMSENKQRRKRQFQLSLPQHERLLLRWDQRVLTALAQSPLTGGYSGAFARHGAAKCLEVLEQALDDLEGVECPDQHHEYMLQAPAKAGQPLHISCKAAAPVLAGSSEL